MLHEKFAKAPDQSSLWQDRAQKDVDFVPTVASDPYYLELDALVESRLGALDARTYLEVGCYFGYRLARHIREFADRSFVGVDLGPANLKKALELAPELEGRLVCADAAQLPFPDLGFDCVYTVVCLTHVPYESAARAVSELARVCAKTMLLVEIDHRPMGWRDKIRCLNWDYGYMHAYEKLAPPSFALMSIRPLKDGRGHPRYTFFEFERKAAA